jgi:hypothetical protein
VCVCVCDKKQEMRETFLGNTRIMCELIVPFLCCFLVRTQVPVETNVGLQKHMLSDRRQYMNDKI